MMPIPSALTVSAEDAGSFPGLHAVHSVGSSDAPLLMLGTILAGSYEVRGWLGSGGMAQVFEAHDVNLDRRVAVKAARPASSESLRAEGRALGALRHAAIVGVLHAGEHRGIDYLVLEHVAGHSLRALLDEKRQQGSLVPLEEVVRIVRGIAEALSVVHRSGLSHRDLKPDNVMIAPGDRVVLMDFGLARPEFRPGNDHVSGSPHYMAPEVITRSVLLGEGHHVDLYALGVVAYELLAGHPPFEHDTERQLLCAHVIETPLDPRAMRGDVPPRLARLILDLLAKEPSARPESAEMVLEALDDRSPYVRRVP